MSRDDLLWIGLVIALLIGGLLIGQRVLNVPQDPAGEGERAEIEQYPPGGGAFRAWLWESRSLDLAAQVGLIFVGALGIAALLPRSGEDEAA